MRLPAFFITVLLVAFSAPADPKHVPVEVAPMPRVAGPDFGDEATRVTMEQSALGFLLKANELRVPSTNAEWLTAMGKHSEPRSVWVPFSANPKKTSFCEPRLLMAAFGPPNKANGLDLSGNLFVATITRQDGTRDLEFISKNRATNEFDFGVIENWGQPGKQKIQLADKSKCVVCHRTGGPFFSDTPWSQSVLNPAMLRVMSEKLADCKGKAYVPFRDEIRRLAAEAEKSSKNPKNQMSHFEHSLQDSKIVREAKLEGVPIFQLRPDPAQPEEPVVQVDRIISQANSARRVHQLLDALADEKVKSKARELAAEIATRHTWGDAKGAQATTAQLKALLDKANFKTTKLPSLQPFRMSDFNPAFPDGVRKFGEGIGEVDDFANDALRASTLDAIRKHDAERVAETYSPPKKLLPSGTAAFGDRPMTMAEAIERLDPELIAFALGAHARDAALLEPFVQDLAGKAPKQQLLDALVASPEFTAASARGTYVRRDELVDGLLDALVAQGKKHSVSVRRPERAAFVAAAVTTTAFKKAGPLATVAPLLAQDRCVTCHKTIGKPLRFSPDDVAGWQQWLASEDATQKAAARRWLRKTIEVLDDKSMPPEDSTEWKGFAAERGALLQRLKELVPAPPMPAMPK